MASMAAPAPVKPRGINASSLTDTSPPPVAPQMSGTFSNVTSTTVNSLSITCAPLNDLASNTTAIVLPLPALTPNGSIPFTFTNFEGFNTVWTDYQQPPVLISKLGLCGRATEPAPVLV